MPEIISFKFPGDSVRLAQTALLPLHDTLKTGTRLIPPTLLAVAERLETGEWSVIDGYCITKTNAEWDGKKFVPAHL